MNKWILRLGALGIAVAVTLGIVASTSAQGPGGQNNPWRDRGDRLGQRLIEVTAEATGLPTEEIWAQLQDGESLMDIAEANGVEPEVMLDLVKTEVGAEIEAALEDGALGELWADRVSARVDGVLGRAMHASLPGVEHPGAVRALREVVQVLGAESDLLPRSIWLEVVSGESLAEIAAAQGVDVETLLADVEAHVAEHLDAAVEDGWMTAQERDRLMTALSDGLPELVNEPLAAWLDGPWALGEDRFDATLSGTIADLAGIELDDLLSENFSLPSLEDVATRYGLDPDAVLAETEARLTDAINAAVAEGSITQAQADALLEGLGDRLEQRFESSFGPLYRGMAGHWDRHWGGQWGGHGRMWR